MKAAIYTFFLNTLKINSKASNGDYVDKDWVIFFATAVGVEQVAPACGAVAGGVASQTAAANPYYINGYIGLAKNGDQLLLCNQPQSAGPFLGTVPPGTDLANANRDGWVVGPMALRDEDSVTIFYVVTNLSYLPPSEQLQTALKIGGYVAAAAGAAASLGAVAAGVTAALASIGSLIGGGLNAILNAVSGLVGSDQIDCNGPVAISPGLTFTGAELEEMVNTPVPNQQQGVTLFTTTIVNSGLTSPSAGGCGTPNTDVTWSILRDIIPQRVFPTTPTPTTNIVAIPASRSVKDWNGVWGDGQFTNNSRILCGVNASGEGVAGESSEQLASSYMAGLIDTMEKEPLALSAVGEDPRMKRESALTLKSIPKGTRKIVSGAAAVKPVTARYSAEILERLGSAEGRIVEQLTAANLVEVPMLAPPFAGDIYPPSRPGEAVGVNATLAGPAKTSVTEQGSLVVAYAATLLVSADISLQLYGLATSENQIVAYRVRYLRRNDDGVTVTDVMLAPVQAEPS